MEDRIAKGIFRFIKSTLAEYDLSVDGQVFQSYDGASVMSGDYNGLQRLISDFCGRLMLYIQLLFTQD